MSSTTAGEQQVPAKLSATPVRSRAISAAVLTGVGSVDVAAYSRFV